MERLISRYEAAEILGVTPQTITNWMDSGVINGHRIKHNGRTHQMVDRNTVMSILDDAKDIEKTEERIAKMKEELEEEERNFNFKKAIVDKTGVDQRATVAVIDIAKSFVGYYLQDRTRMRDIVMDFIDGLQLTTIAQKNGITAERTRQIVCKAARIMLETETYEDMKKKNEALEHRLGELENAYKMTSAELNRIEAVIRKHQILCDGVDGVTISATEDEQATIRLFNLLKERLVDFDLSVRALNCLKSIGCETVGDVVQQRKINFLKCRNFGKKSLCEIEDFVESLGLHFEMDIEPIVRRYNEIVIDKMKAETDNTSTD